MKNNKKLASICLFLGLLAGQQAQARQQTIPGCESNSAAEQGACLERRMNQSEDALRMTENAALQLVQQWDEADSISIQAQNRLRATGKTFRTYRNAQCGFVANLGGVTRQRELENDQMACIYHFNVDRTNHLTEVLSEIRRR